MFYDATEAVDRAKKNNATSYDSIHESYNNRVPGWPLWISDVSWSCKQRPQTESFVQRHASELFSSFIVRDGFFDTLFLISFVD